LIQEGVNGSLFEPGNPSDLAEKVSSMWEDYQARTIMGENARRVYEEKYTAEKNYEMLLNIYSLALQNRQPL
jgi:glycosyltransferase involved in cell wall biosynthesis